MHYNTPNKGGKVPRTPTRLELLIEREYNAAAAVTLKHFKNSGMSDRAIADELALRGITTSTSAVCALRNELLSQTWEVAS